MVCSSYGRPAEPPRRNELLGASREKSLACRWYGVGLLNRLGFVDPIAARQAYEPQNFLCIERHWKEIVGARLQYFHPERVIGLMRVHQHSGWNRKTRHRCEHVLPRGVRQLIRTHNHGYKAFLEKLE